MHIHESHGHFTDLHMLKFLFLFFHSHFIIPTFTQISQSTHVFSSPLLLSLLPPLSSPLIPHPSLLPPHSSPLTPPPSLLPPHSSPLTPPPSLLTTHSSPLTTPPSLPTHSHRSCWLGAAAKSLDCSSCSEKSSPPQTSTHHLHLM